MNTQSDNLNTIKLMTMLDSVKPIFKDLEKLIIETKNLDSKYKNHLNHLKVYFKLEGTHKQDPVTEKEIEYKVKSICIVLEEIGKFMTVISTDEEESRLYFQTGIMDKFQDISLRMSQLIS